MRKLDTKRVKVNISPDPRLMNPIDERPGRLPPNLIVITPEENRALGGREKGQSSANHRER